MSFRAETMPDALAQARDQMGPDALVLTTRKVFDGPAWQVWRNPVFDACPYLCLMPLPPPTTVPRSHQLQECEVLFKDLQYATH